jgi:hypothetical protein
MLHEGERQNIGFLQSYTAPGRERLHELVIAEEKRAGARAVAWIFSSRVLSFIALAQGIWAGGGESA